MLSIFLAVLIVASSIITIWMRNYAIRRNLLDVPNERSSHDTPTPRGGGAAIVATVFIGLIVASLVDWVPHSTVVTIVVGGSFVAGVGYIDDHSHVPALWRMLVHLVVGIYMVTTINGATSLPVLGTQIDLGWIGAATGILWVAWLVNLFNFMDGIDGIAAIESITVTFGAALILWSSDQPQLAVASAVIGSASLGFLMLNWPPASIFMGDIGSGFLGFALAAMALLTNASESSDFWIWPILLGVFIVDATVTLCRRLIRGDKIYQAHRTHAYQCAARRFGDHKPVTLAVAATNILWLMPIALYASVRPESGWWLTLIAWVPLVLLSLVLHAGDPELEA